MSRAAGARSLTYALGVKIIKPMKEFLSIALIGLTLCGCAGAHVHRISKDEARVVLTAFVNQEFERKTLAEASLPREGRLAWPRLSQQNLRFVELSRGR